MAYAIIAFNLILDLPLVTMNRLARCIFISIILLSISACGNSSSNSNSAYQELSWDDLKTDEDKQREMEQVEYFGSLEIIDTPYTDELEERDRGIYTGAPPQAISIGVVEKIDGKSIRMAGFLVPIEFSAENLISEFFLVPYFGACFHLPPPPPNQIIYVSSSEPFKYENIEDPIWVMGVINAEQTGNDIATASYSMYLDKLEPYEE